MREAGLPGELAVWGDVLWDGPVLPGRPRAEEIVARARWFAGPGGDPGPLVAMQEAWDAGLARAADHDEVVIWLEHDLHDQCLLLHHLDHFSRLPHPRVSLICIGEFPGIEPFHGLGQLTGHQLASLFPHRAPITPAQLALGIEGWAALREPAPTAIAELLERDTRPLPFLAGALRRLLEEYPAPASGLGRTEATALAALADGPASPESLFRALQRQEERVFLGDLGFARILEALAAGDEPLLTLAPGTATITERGRAALAGAFDRAALPTLDRWLGGVHLQGPAVRWRWDPVRARLLG